MKKMEHLMETNFDFYNISFQPDEYSSSQKVILILQTTAK